METRKCPMCRRIYEGYPAISRTQGHEEICPACGTKQAITQFKVAGAPTYQTRNIAEWVRNAPEALEFIFQSLNRHMRFDYGEMDAEDVHTNDLAIIHDDRLFSSYDIPEALADEADDNKIWIITEADRSSTTILFPSEY